MKRRAFTIWEMMLACMVLATLTTICMAFFGAAKVQRRQIFEQFTANQEAESLMERAQALTWDGMTKQAAAGLHLSPQAQKTLPEGRVEVNIEDVSGAPPARRVAVIVHWRPLSGEPEREARLVAWRYKGP